MPDDLIAEIGIFAGRLYSEHDEVVTLLDYVARTKFHNDSQASKTRTLNFVYEWITRRRKGQDFGHTPIGYICSGRILAQDHPFFGTSTKERGAVAVLQQSVNHLGLDGAGEMEDDDDDEEDIVEMDGEDVHG